MQTPNLTPIAILKPLQDHNAEKLRQQILRILEPNERERPWGVDPDKAKLILFIGLTLAIIEY